MDEIRAEITKQRQRRDREASRLAEVISQRRAEAGALAPLLSFYGYNKQLVAIAQILGDRARVSRFSDIGPMGHFTVKDLGQLAYELRMEGFNPTEDPEAAATLEIWVGQQKWSDGLYNMQVLALYNTLRDHKYNEQAEEVWVSRDIGLGYRYCKKFNLTGILEA